MFRPSKLLMLALSLVICGWSGTVSAAVKLPAVIGSDMVLQQGASLPIWGWADKGESVTVSIAGQISYRQSRRRRPLATHARQA